VHRWHLIVTSRAPPTSWRSWPSAPAERG
jgi:hypothetical protein